jgi:colanic acid/amylovoran biosynthesis protein
MPIAYSRKFAGVFGTLGYDHLADCKTMTADEVIKVTVDGFHQREQLARDVADGMKQAEVRLGTLRGGSQALDARPGAGAGSWLSG